MDGRLALGALAAIPLLYATLAWLSLNLGPLTGWGVGLCAYWVALGAAMLAFADREGLGDLLPAKPPGRLVLVALALPVVVMGAVAMRTLGRVVLPAHLVLAAAIAAVATAFLEEMFWRGALLPRLSPRAAALALGLFALFHLAWLGVEPLATGVPAPLLVLGPLALGGVWTAARLASGTLGAGILGHAGFNLFLFVQVVALNWPPPA